jgi:hypothetical protein
MPSATSSAWRRLPGHLDLEPATGAIDTMRPVANGSCGAFSWELSPKRALATCQTCRRLIGESCKELECGKY